MIKELDQQIDDLQRWQNQNLIISEFFDLMLNDYKQIIKLHGQNFQNLSKKIDNFKGGNFLQGQSQINAQLECFQRFIQIRIDSCEKLVQDLDQEILISLGQNKKEIKNESEEAQQKLINKFNILQQLGGQIQKYGQIYLQKQQTEQEKDQTKLEEKIDQFNKIISGMNIYNEIQFERKKIQQEKTANLITDSLNKFILFNTSSLKNIEYDTLNIIKQFEEIEIKFGKEEQNLKPDIYCIKMNSLDFETVIQNCRGNKKSLSYFDKKFLQFDIEKIAKPIQGTFDKIQNLINLKDPKKNSQENEMVTLKTQNQENLITEIPLKSNRPRKKIFDDVKENNSFNLNIINENFVSLDEKKQQQNPRKQNLTEEEEIMQVPEIEEQQE